jgi:hypothetical protein
MTSAHMEKGVAMNKNKFPVSVKIILDRLSKEDLVVVVRCKDCKWAFPNREGDLDCRCHIPIFRTDMNGFCWRGERR